jgi:outer membrane protein
VLAAGIAAAQTAPSPAPQPLPATPGAGVLSAADPDLVMSIRGGVAFSTSYLGSDEYELGPDAAFRIDYLRLPGGFEFGSARPTEKTGLGLRGSIRYIGERDDADNEELTGLEDVDRAFEAGLGIGYEQRNYRVFTDVRYGIVGHNAWAGEIGADGIARPMDGLTLTVGPRLAFGDSRFSDTYFGVSAPEAAASGLEEFDASGGLLSAGVEVGARYLLNDRWGVEGAASWNRLLNDAADSPITELGSEDQYRVRLGITRSLSLDF